MRRIRIYNEAIDTLKAKKMIVVPTLTMLGGSLALLLGALWWVLHD